MSGVPPLGGCIVDDRLKAEPQTLMKQQQRFIIALVASAAVLIIWNVLFPVKPPPPDPNANANANISAQQTASPVPTPSMAAAASATATPATQAQAISSPV